LPRNVFIRRISYIQIRRQTYSGHAHSSIGTATITMTTSSGKPSCQ
jgi:hypothetical protein